MFILLISRGIPSDKDPQWGCFERDQALALHKAGHKVVVLSVDSRVRVKNRKLGISHKNIEGVDLYNLYWFPNVIFRPIIYRVMLFLISWQLDYLYKKIVKIHGTPDVIYSHYLLNSYAALNLKKKYNLPVVAIEHWSEVNKDILKPYVQYLGNNVYSTVDKVISVSDSLKSMIYKHFNVDSLVVHNLVGEGFGYKLPSYHTSFNFVTVGSLFHIKGYDILIEAFAKIAHGNNFKLTIVGDGNQRTLLQQLIVKHNLQSKVLLVGRKSRPEVADILANSDVYVSSSRNENFSVSVLEALSVGLPVVATICGGIKECINGSNGLLVPTEDVNALSSAMLKITQNISNYNRESIAQDFENRFSTKTIVNNLVSIFESVKYK
ncbi:MAG: glycosyltransferase family 4 protein [Paludibacteraceae bacterium]|nr:glycosyltransferase family 4 protein [Paludibacteraceae bacterium]